MTPSDKALVHAHLTASVGLFGAALFLGVFQFWFRSPVPPAFGTIETYYQSVTAHGTIIAYAFPTLFAMGLGYAIAATATGRPHLRRNGAWAAFTLLLIGLAMALAAVAAGRATVLYTFYPPMLASAFYYLGVTILVLASWFWIAQTIWTFHVWKRENPGKTTPLGLYLVTAMAYLWLWTSLGAAAELLFELLPLSFGWVERIDVGLARTLYSWTLHAISYFWLLPAYLAYYLIVPADAGGRLYSDQMGRLAFVLFMVFGISIGLHHLFMDPEHGSAFKFLQGGLSSFVASPTMLTVFTMCASLEIAGRLRGGKGRLGWVRALPWDRPMVLAIGLSLVMLGLGGLGGLINMSYAMNSTVHNTAWVTAHFHLIFGGAVVIMYFAIAYKLWPVLTGKPLASVRLARLQLIGWFVGMMTLTLPWHATGIMGQARRVARFDYADPTISATAFWTLLSLGGAVLALISVLTFLFILVRTEMGPRTDAVFELELSKPAVPNARIPNALNGFGVWNALAGITMLAAYGWPILQFFVYPSYHVTPVLIGGLQ